MAKTSGLAYAVQVTDVDGNVRDISSDVTGWTVGGSGVTLHGVVNIAPGMSHSVFRDVTSSDVPRTVVIENTRTPEMPGFDGAVKFADYQITRNSAGELAWTASGTVPGAADSELLAQIREHVRVQGGGDVQKAFGRP